MSTTQKLYTPEKLIDSKKIEALLDALLDSVLIVEENQIASYNWVTNYSTTESLIKFAFEFWYVKNRENISELIDDLLINDFAKKRDGVSLTCYMGENPTNYSIINEHTQPLEIATEVHLKINGYIIQTTRIKFATTANEKKLKELFEKLVKNILFKQKPLEIEERIDTLTQIIKSHVVQK